MVAQKRRKGLELLAKFGNDWALRRGEEQLRQLAGVEVVVRDRRTLRVIIREPNGALRDEVRTRIRTSFGYLDEELELR